MTRPRRTNRPYPTTAQIALKMGAHAAKNIQAQLKGEATKPFSFKSQGTNNIDVAMVRIC
jgi:NADH dehydrogenase